MIFERVVLLWMNSVFVQEEYKDNASILHSNAYNIGKQGRTCEKNWDILWLNSKPGIDC
jgi:hypothetical protein